MTQTTQQTVAAPKFALEDDGTIVHNQKNGKRIILGSYDEETKRLEFESKEVSIKYRAQILNLIGTSADGTTPSDRAVRSMGIKGEVAEETEGLPPRPKMDKNFGDATPAVVEWYFQYKPKEAYVRYGVRLDSEGNPVRGNCVRKTTQLVDKTGLDDSQLQEVKTSMHSSEKGPITEEKYMEQHNNVMIASRATHMTFLKEDQVGYDGSDDDEWENMNEGGNE